MTVKIKKASNKKVVTDISKITTSADWTGSDTQASRSFDFSVIKNPNDENFFYPEIELGDIVYFFFGGKLRFLGRVTEKSQASGVQEESFKAQDYMNLLLRSKLSANFKNTTPEKITKNILSKVGIPVGKLEVTKAVIAKWIVEEETPYNVIIGAYYKGYKKTGKKYFPYMDGTRFCIGEKGLDSKVRLYLSKNVTGTELSQNAQEIVNRIEIYDENGKKIGRVEDKQSIKFYGIVQDIYKKEKGVNAFSEAKKMLVGASKEANVDALGNIECIAGRSVRLYDADTGLWGKFIIENDSHSFSNGQHTMSLKLAFSNIMEGAAQGTGKHPIATGDCVAYYSETAEKFHSARKCGTGLVAPIKTTVNEAIKLGKSKCSRCWQ